MVKGTHGPEVCVGAKNWAGEAGLHIRVPISAVGAGQTTHSVEEEGAGAKQARPASKGHRGHGVCKGDI